MMAKTELDERHNSYVTSLVFLKLFLVGFSSVVNVQYYPFICSKHLYLPGIYN